VGKDAAEAQLARVREAGRDPGSEAARQTLREVLKGRDARAITWAAALAAERDLEDLAPDLHTALVRLLGASIKADAGCAAKTALCETLDRLGETDLALSRSCARHVQSERSSAGAWTPRPTCGAARPWPSPASIPSATRRLRRTRKPRSSER
jgi:hypothetical protein